MPDSDDAQRASPKSHDTRSRPIVGQVVSRAQHLVDSRPPGLYQPKWCQEALYVGDLTALAAASLCRTAMGAP
jgi:hypothetical protein